MKIHVLVYVESGIISEVQAFKSPVMAERSKRAILREHGDCMQDFGDTDPVKYAYETGEDLTEIDGKHYHHNEDDCLNVFEVDLPHARN